MKLRTFLVPLCLLHAVIAAADDSSVKNDPKALPPGVVIDHIAASTGLYVGSPSIAILPNGDYVASHDLFGPKSTEGTVAVSRVFGSSDRGQTWQHLTDIHGAFWSTLFVHRGDLYLMGPSKGYGNLVIRRSNDGGKTWTVPKDKDSGLLFQGNFHTATMPFALHQGRLWRAVETTSDPGKWASKFESRMLSAPEDADLLKASSWTLSEPAVPAPKIWLDGKFGGWLEGNAVVTPEGKLVNILRVHSPFTEEKAAVVQISDDGRTAAFDPATGFIDMPGGSKKFTIRFDPTTKLFWTLANYVPLKERTSQPDCNRNTLALASSPDLRHWTVQAVIFQHPDRKLHGFQYADWQFDGDDLVVASRTAFDDGDGGAHNFHDANYLTFHRVKSFRTLHESVH